MKIKSLIHFIPVWKVHLILSGYCENTSGNKNTSVAGQLF